MIFVLDIYEYLNQKDNSLPRAGAITLGGLSGIILGLRGGFFKRLIYGSIGAGAIASVCYPKEAEIYAQQALVESKKYALIAYNFAYGSKLYFFFKVENYKTIFINKFHFYLIQLNLVMQIIYLNFQKYQQILTKLKECLATWQNQQKMQFSLKKNN